jgi:hypothetical protein
MWILLMSMFLSAVPAPGRPCKTSPDLAGACFTVHGRLRAYNGNPTFRIWPVGTNRLLGVTGPHPGEEPILPDDLRCGFDCDIYADFEVCPFTAPEAGVMQRVCVEAAEKRVVMRKKTLGPSR